MRHTALDLHHQARDFIPNRRLPPRDAILGYAVGPRGFGLSDAWGSVGLCCVVRFVRVGAL